MCSPGTTHWLRRLVLCAWASFAVLCHGGAVYGGTTPCDASSFPGCLSGECPLGQGCRSDNTTCTCVPTGCCLVTVKTMQCIPHTKDECDAQSGNFIPNAFCSFDNCVLLPTATPTVTPTVTPSVTPTVTRVPNGGSCMTPAECASLNCVNGVCAGFVSPAPAVSSNGLAIGLAILIGLGAVGLWRMQRLRE